MVNTTVTLGKGFALRNPVITASGTFGYGTEYSDFIDFSRLGGIVVKGTTLLPREGNPYPRMAETPSGMLNAVGLQNKGTDYFIDKIWPTIRDYDTEMIVNVSGAVVEDYVKVAERLADLEKLHAIELNISCPNVKEGGMAFGTSPQSAAAVTAAVRKVWPRNLIVKLSPNVTDITEIARAAEGAGADCLSLINTMLGMAVDTKTRRPILSTVTGGLSGPAIRPIALRMVWQTAKAVSIPIIGMGGISDADSALQFIMAGASAIQIGTANFIDPAVTMKVVDGIENYMLHNNIKNLNEIKGCI